jgi:hypothetical protein
MFTVLTGNKPDIPSLSSISLIPFLLTGCLLLANPLQATEKPTLQEAKNNVFGDWVINTPERITLLQLNHNRSYLHLELNLSAPQNSVAEWGRLDLQSTTAHFIPSYSNNAQQGLVAYQFEHPQLNMMLTSLSLQLALTIDTNADSIADEQHHYNLTTNQSVYGVWHQLSTPALSSLVLLDNGYYAMVNINLHQDPQANAHVTHLQWGQFELHQNQLTLEPIFNSHPQQASNLSSTIPSMVYQPSKQQLTLSFMGKGNPNDIEMNQQYER